MTARAFPRPALVATKPVVITGGAGFIGSNLALRLAERGRDVVVIDSFARPGVERNADELRRTDPRRISIVGTDVREQAAADAVRDAAAVVHLAAQVAVTTSLGDPLFDFDVNTRGTLNVLEAARTCAKPPLVLFASTNKVYGDLGGLEIELTATGYAPRDAAIRERGIGESWPLSFHTPYGCSKGAADQYVLDYARNLGVPAASMRMSCIYGPRQLGNEDQGWVAHFLIAALDRRPITIFGDGQQVRDVLFVADAVEVYARALERPGAVAGRAFNVGGGTANAVSLTRVLAHIERILGEPLDVRYADWRPADQRYFVSDASAVRAALDLPAPVAWTRGVTLLCEWLRANRRPAGAVVGEALS